MTKFKAKNEKIKRRHLQWLKEAQGYSDKTIYEVEKSLWKFEAFSKEADYAAFNQKQAKEFKSWLSRQTHQGKALSLVSQYHYLRHVKSFFLWLSGQPGYKSRVSVFDVQLLSLDKQQSRIAKSIRPVKYPTVFYVKKLCASIEIKTEVDLRDRALIAFHFLSGMRVFAILSLPLKCFNPHTLEVFQSPKDGVKTKFSKQIMTTLFRFDETLLGYILEWQEMLRTTKLFDDTAPLFPRTKVTQCSEQNFVFLWLPRCQSSK
ncbi:MAG: hypothetical protein AB7F28_03935 [Candidatus Margulisiibacteriota bacterium]